MSFLVGGILITFSGYLNVKFLAVKQVIVFNILASGWSHLEKKKVVLMIKYKKKKKKIKLLKFVSIDLNNVRF